MILSIVVVPLIIGTAIPVTRPDSYTIRDLENPPQYVCIQALFSIMSVCMLLNTLTCTQLADCHACNMIQPCIIYTTGSIMTI